MTLRIHLLVITSLVLAMPASAEKFRFERPLMGTRFVIVCHSDDHDAATEAANAAFRVAEEINAVASDHMPDSELSMLSTQPAGKSVDLSPLLYTLLEFSRQTAEATEGAFDPTLGPLTKLWRETRDRRSLPDPEKLQFARGRSGWQHFTLDSSTRTITLHCDNMAFDLGAVAKGYAADLMLESLSRSGIHQAMVVAGGEIRLGDPPPERSGWRVALQTFDTSSLDETIILSNAAVSTSGDLFQSVEIEGIRYSHVLSPTTGLGLTQRIAAIVIADEAKLSDALSTAACVLGASASEKLRGFPGLRELRVKTPKETVLHYRETIPTTH
jgi:thiamine biosynthesis lipoprotein